MSNNKLYCQLISDICELPVLSTSVKSNDSSVLLGSTICGASNSSEFKDIGFDNLMRNFLGDSENCQLLSPSTNEEMSSFHQQKYNIYLSMIEDQRRYQSWMDKF